MSTEQALTWNTFFVSTATPFLCPSASAVTTNPPAPQRRPYSTLGKRWCCCTVTLDGFVAAGGGQQGCFCGTTAQAAKAGGVPCLQRVCAAASAGSAQAQRNLLLQVAPVQLRSNGLPSHNDLCITIIHLLLLHPIQARCGMPAGVHLLQPALYALAHPYECYVENCKTVS